MKNRFASHQNIPTIYTNDLRVDLPKRFDGYFGVSVSITGFGIHSMVIQGPEVLNFKAGCK